VNVVGSFTEASFLAVLFISTSETTSADDYQDFEEVHLEPNSSVSKNDFLDELSGRALEAADRSDKVVVRYVTESFDCQDSMVNRLIQGGASHENITVVRLAPDHREHRNSGSSYQTQYCTWRPKTVLA